jgi:hypothetical protein
MRKANFTLANVWGWTLALAITVVANVNLSAQCSLTCNNLVQVSLDEDCSVEINDDMILEGNPAQYCPNGNFQVQAKIGNSWLPASGNFVANNSHVNQTIQVRVRDLNSGQICWGYIKVEDKLAPQVDCEDIFIPCAASNFSPSALSALGYTAAFPNAVDNCSSVTSTFSDTWFDLPCGTVQQGDLSGYIRRNWQFVDSYGNSTTCTQFIYVTRIHVGDVSYPTDVTVSCTNPNTSPSATGVPFYYDYDLDITVPFWPSASYCELNVTYTDQVLPVCDGTYKILRTWVVYDWCLPTSPFPPTSNPQYYVQLVKVVDDQGPVVPAVDDITVSTNSNNCCANVDLPNVIVEDACSQIASATASISSYDEITGDLVSTFTVNASITNFPGNNLWTPDTLVNFGWTACLPIGTNEVVYTITDDCGNVTTREFEVTIEDQTPPTVAADEWTQISLNINGEAEINASTFDDGSYDNCGPVYFKVRRMDSNPCQDNSVFRSRAKFCCSDLGDTVVVIFRVYDVDPGAGDVGLDAYEGHYTDVMVNVLIEDKVKPTCQPPANVTVSCEAFDPTYWQYGNVTATDNCSNPTVLFATRVPSHVVGL